MTQRDEPDRGQPFIPTAAQISDRFDEIRDVSNVVSGETQQLSIAGHAIAVRHHSADSREMIGRAVSHLEARSAADGDATESVFRVGLGDRILQPSSLGRAIPDLPEEAEGQQLFDMGSGSVGFEHAGLVWWDRESLDGGWWLRHEQPALFRLGAPMLSLFDLWGESIGLPTVHCAAIGSPEKMVVLGAPGGAGKSTLAVAGLQRGLSFCGDDYCMIQVGADGESPRVHSLFATAKLDAFSQQLVPDSAELERLPGLADNDRTVFDLRGHPGLLASGRVNSVITPVQVGGSAPRLVEVAPLEALRSIAITSVFLMPSSRRLAWKTLSAMCRTVPCYRLEVGDDPTKAVDLLGEIAS